MMMEAPTTPQADKTSVSSGAATNDAPSTTNCRNRKVVWVSVIVVLAAAIAAIVYFTTRPKAISVRIVESVESVPVVIKAAALVDPSGAISGTVTIEYTTLLSDPSTIMYYMNGRELVFLGGKEGAAATNDTITLYLTRSSNPTLEDTLLEESSSIAIPSFFRQDLPFSLPAKDFFPGDYNGILLVDTDDQDHVVVSSFDILVNPAQNIASTDSIPGNDNSIGDVDWPSSSPTPGQDDTNDNNSSSTGEPGQDNTNDNNSSSTGDVDSPSASPTLEQDNTNDNNSSSISTQQPQDETPDDSTNDQQDATPPILVSTLDGSYGITGTITISYRNGLGNDGQVRTIAVMTFDIPSAPSGAPLPILYLSQRPFSETENGSLAAADILVPLDGAEKGSFTLQGTFEQELDEIDNATLLNDYTNGSWIVWCEPFAVWLGGGPIQTQ